MSMIRQVWLLIVGIILLACVGSVAISVATARSYLEAQLALKNNDNAQSLALTLSQQKGDRELIELAVAAQFDTGYYRSILLRGPDGLAVVQRKAPERTMEVPDWFLRVVPISSAPGVAQVSNGWTSLGTVEVVSQPSFAYATLWSGALRTALGMLALGVLAGFVGWLAVRQLRRPLDAVVEQAAALTQRRFVTISEPSVPELKRVTQALNATVERVHAMFAEQVDQIEQLRRLANCDALTGVAHRRHFLSRLEDELLRDTGGGRGLLLLMRVGDLAQANRALGHALTDGLLRDAARALESPQPPEKPLLVGRLNGSDFALLCDHNADGDRVARAALSRVQQVFAAFDKAQIVASGVVWHRGDGMAQVLEAADAALARAELRGHGAFELVGSISNAGVQGGEDSWRRGLQQALSQDWVHLVEYPLVDARSQLVHLECPLRLRLEADGTAQPAAVWLPYAVRTGLIARFDLVAARLALERIDVDGRPRGVNVAPASLADPNFVPLLRGVLEEHSEAASRLCIEVDEVALTTVPSGLAELCHQLRPLAVRVGVEHAGERAAQASALLAIGLDFVKLRASFTAGCAEHDAQGALMRSAVSVLHGLGVKVYAEGVGNAQDLAALWRCGIDGVTGPVVQLADR